MPRSLPVDGFSLEYDRAGSGPAVVLLHGWPGSRDDQRDVAALLAGGADVVVPDLRGFGGSDRHAREPAEAYSADAQTDSVCALIEELELDRPVLSGYDVGSRVAQTIAARLPDDVRALVVAPPMPGVGRRVLEPDAQREFSASLDLSPGYARARFALATVLLRTGKRADARAAFDRAARDANGDAALVNLALSMRNAIAPQ